VSNNDIGKRLIEGIKNAGRSEVVLAAFPPVTFPNEVTLVNLTADDSEGNMVTVYLVTTPENTTAVPVKDYVPYVVAIVEWGTDGFQHTAEIDFTRGTAFSVAASYLRVKAGLDKQAFLGTFPVLSPQVRCAATVAYGTRPGHYPAPTRTLWFRNLDADGVASAEQEIPAFARDLTLMWSKTIFPVPVYRLEILDSASVIVEVRFAGGGFGVSTQAVPLPSDARLVRVVNPVAGSVLQDFRVVAGLAF